MRLLYITNQICGAGGLERVLSIKTSYLVENFDYDIHIITLNQENRPLFYEFNKKLKYHDLKVKGNPINYIINYLTGIRKKIKEINPDIISVCDDGLKAFFLPSLLGKPCPMIYERHVSKNIVIKTESYGILSKLKTNITFWLMNYGGKKYDKFIVLTKDNLKEWNFNNLHVISNPLSFTTTERSTLENQKVLVVGRHCFQKGYDRLLYIWEKVVKKHPDWHLDIYGKFDVDETFIKLSKKLNIDSKINFYEPVKNIQDKYKEASIYLMTSRFEGFGMVLIEAMAYGVPCISFNCPCGPEEIITNEEDGFLISNGNINEFSNKVNVLIENSSLRQRMGSKAIQKAKLYAPEVIVPQWDNLFKELITQ